MDASTPAAFPASTQGRPGEDSELVAVLSQTRTESGRTLLELLDEKPMLLVFLRYFGCPFCREALSDIAKVRPELDRRGVRPVFVHMAPPGHAQSFFERFGLADVERVSDPEKKLYTAPEFHLLKDTVLPDFYGAKAMWVLAKRALFRYGQGRPVKDEDRHQLPGIFFLQDRAIRRAFRHKHMYDRPDYARFGA